MIRELSLPHVLATAAVSAAVVVANVRSYPSPHAAVGIGREAAPEQPILAMPLPRIATVRDPFTVGSDENVARPQPPASAVIAEPSVAAPSAPAASDASSVVHLRAVVLGERRYALVATGDSTRIVGVGDALAGSRISSVTLAGIRLANGATFAPEENSK